MDDLAVKDMNREVLADLQSLTVRYSELNDLLKEVYVGLVTIASYSDTKRHLTDARNWSARMAEKLETAINYRTRAGA